MSQPGSAAPGQAGPPVAGSLLPGTVRARWAVGACALLGAVAYRELLAAQPDRALSEELEQWFFVPTQSITPLVVAMSLWLVYRRAARLRQLPDVPGPPGVGALLLLGGWAVHLWATWTAAVDLLVPSLMLTVAGLAWLWRGPGAVRLLRLPIAFLVFAMPLPPPLLNEVVFRFQIWTADLAGLFLYLLGIPHFVAGDQILRPEQTFSVIESCSGLRSVETLTMVSILMMDLFRRRGLHAWLVVLAAPPLAFLLNGLRALLLILNPHSGIASVHNLQGVAILLSGLVLLFLWDGVLEWLLRARASRAREPAPAAPPAPARSGAGRGRLGLALAALAAGAGVSLWQPRWEPPEEVAPNLTRRLANRLGLARGLEMDRTFLGSVGFRDALLRSVVVPGGEAVVFIGVGAPEDRHQSALSPKTALPGSGWVVEGRELELLPPDGRSALAQVLRRGSERWLVYHWTEGAGSLASESLRSLLALDRSPLGRRVPILVLRIAVPLEGPLERARPAAREKVLRLYAQLRPLLDESARSGAPTGGGRLQ